MSVFMCSKLGQWKEKNQSPLNFYQALSAHYFSAMVMATTVIPVLF